MSWWISGAERTLSEDIPAAPEVVRAFYVELDNIRLVHPFVISVRGLERTDSASGYVQTYQVRDRIPLGRFTLRTSYVVRLHVPSVGDVVAEARQFPRVRLRTVVVFDRIDDGTQLTERMRINAPRLLAAMTVHEAVKAHTAMLANIRRRFSE